MASMSIQVAQPLPGATLWGPASGVRIAVKGGVTIFPGGRLSELSVQLDGGPAEDADLDGWRWSYTGHVTTQGNHTITIDAHGVAPGPHGVPQEVFDSATVAVSISFDTSPRS